jgi:hypothetical protein
MVTACNDYHIVGLRGVNQAMFVVDPPRPIAGEIAFERFGFADAFERASKNIEYPGPAG